MCIRSVLLFPVLAAAAAAAEWDRFDVRFQDTPDPWNTAGQGMTASFVASPEEAGTSFLSLSDSAAYGQAVMPGRIPVQGLMEVRASARVRHVEGEGAKGVIDLLGYDDEGQRLQYRIVIGETTNREWEVVTNTFTVPPGTAELELRFCPAWPREPGVKRPGTSHLAWVTFERLSIAAPPPSYMADVATVRLPDLGDYVPPPWTPVRADQGSVSCWGRDHYWRSGPFPARIVSQGADLLAAPIEVRWTGEGGESGEVGVGSWQIDSLRRSQAVRSAQCTGGCTGSVRVTTDYDGTSRFDLDLDFGPRRLKTLDLVVPLRADVGRFLHYDYGIGAWVRPFPWSGALAEKGSRFGSAFLPFVWLGNDDIGFCVFTESDEAWELDDPARAVEIFAEEDQVLLVFHLVARKEPVRLPARSYTFGLEATPQRPLPPNFRQMHIVHYPGYFGVWKGREPVSLLKRLNLAEVAAAGARYVGLHAWWADRVCGFEPAVEDDFRAFMAEADRLGIRVQTYLAFMLASKVSLHEQVDGRSWLKIPSYGAWNADAADRYRGFNTCPRSSYSKLLVQGALHTAERYGVSGVYWDNHPSMCKNPDHGCGYQTNDAAGRVLRRPTCAMWSARALIKEVYERLKHRDPDAFMTVHLSWFPHPYLMFADTLLTGEGFAREEAIRARLKNESSDIVPLSAFRAELAGTKFGLKTCFCLYESPQYLPPSLVAGECFIHDIDVRKFDKVGWAAPVWQAFDRFETSRSTFVGYWRLEGKAFAPGMIKTSAYVRHEEALLVVANLTREPGETTVNLQSVLPERGMTAGFVARDAVQGDDVPVQDGQIRLQLAEDQYRLVHVGMAGSTTPEP